MPQGLQCWDASGNLILDLTDRITRVLGQVNIAAGASGYITDARFATGTMWWQVVGASGAQAAHTLVLTADPANNRIAYVPGAYSKGATVIYGVF